MELAIPRPSRLDDPNDAAWAMARYWRMMRIMAVVALLTVAATLAFLLMRHGLVSIHLYIAAALGVGAVMMLTGVLMGLVFMSHGTGHDMAVDDPLGDEMGRKHGVDNDQQ